MKTTDGIKISTVKTLPLRPVDGCQVIHNGQLMAYRRGEWVTERSLGKAAIEPPVKSVIY